VIKRLHHAAYRCSDSERTRAFYEDFLGLPLVHTLELAETKTGSRITALHTFFALDDGSCLAFFEAPERPFEFKAQGDLDLHIALEVSREDLLSMHEKGKQQGIETRGISHHGFIESVYFRDPDGYVVELTAPCDNHAEAMDPSQNGARATLESWQRSKARAPASRGHAAGLSDAAQR